MPNHTIVLKDVLCRNIKVSYTDLVTALVKEDFKIFGMTLDNIVDLQSEYQKRNGTMPMTTESIEKAFKN